MIWYCFNNMAICLSTVIGVNKLKPAIEYTFIFFLLIPWWSSVSSWYLWLLGKIQILTDNIDDIIFCRWQKAAYKVW